LLSGFEEKLKVELSKSAVNCADERGVRVGKNNYWLHSLSNAQWAYFMVHKARNTAGPNEMGVLPSYTGYLVNKHNGLWALVDF